MIFRICWLTFAEPEALICVRLAHRFDELFGVLSVERLLFEILVDFFIQVLAEWCWVTLLFVDYFFLEHASTKLMGNLRSFLCVATRSFCLRLRLDNGSRVLLWLQVAEDVLNSFLNIPSFGRGVGNVPTGLFPI